MSGNVASRSGRIITNKSPAPQTAPTSDCGRRIGLPWPVSCYRFIPTSRGAPGSMTLINRPRWSDQASADTLDADGSRSAGRSPTTSRESSIALGLKIVRRRPHRCRGAVAWASHMAWVWHRRRRSQGWNDEPCLRRGPTEAAGGIEPPYGALQAPASRAYRPGHRSNRDGPIVPDRRRNDAESRRAAPQPPALQPRRPAPHTRPRRQLDPYRETLRPD